MKPVDSLRFEQIRLMSDDDARATLEALRWPVGPSCPRCGGKDVSAVAGGRSGLYRCRDCRKDKKQTRDQFTVTVGTIFEDSHIPLAKWLMAFSLVCSSKKGISALQLQRQLELGSYRSAWHMAHRIRYALASDPMRGMLKGIVEADETYVGGKPRRKGWVNRGRMGRGTSKAPVVALVERNGRIFARSMKKVGREELTETIRKNVSPDARLMTDEWAGYRQVGRTMKGGHHTVKHSAGEYARGDVHVNTAESFFALLKRGVHGTFHHVGRQHLGRYCDEFEFRWDHRKTSDGERTVSALRRVAGRRLMYRDLAGRLHV